MKGRLKAADRTAGSVSGTGNRLSRPSIASWPSLVYSLIKGYMGKEGSRVIQERNN